MPTINFNNKKFSLLDNSNNGEASNKTIFHYQQKDNLVTADYQGGSIKYGKIIARQLANNDLKMLYQCLTENEELRAGKAYAKSSIRDDGKIQLDLNWEWLNGDSSSGISVYVEI